MLIQDGLDCLCGRFVPVTFVIPEYVLVEMPIVKDLFSAPPSIYYAVVFERSSSNATASFCQSQLVGTTLSNLSITLVS